MRGTIVAIHHGRKALTVRIDAGLSRQLPSAYAAEQLDHAYALTGHAAQGAALDHAYDQRPDVLDHKRRCPSGAARTSWFKLFGNMRRRCGHVRVMALDEGLLWRRSAKGDVDAFGLLFEQHANAIYNYCFRRMGDWGVAEDMLSTVFLEAWRRRDTEVPEDKVLPWLYGIATNVIRNRQRSDRRLAAALKRVPAARSDPGFSERADERLDDERTMKEALALLRLLPRREQDVFALCAWAGASYEDAALALGIPVGTVQSRLSRARRRLDRLVAESGHVAKKTTSVRSRSHEHRA